MAQQVVAEKDGLPSLKMGVTGHDNPPVLADPIEQHPDQPDE